MRAVLENLPLCRLDSSTTATFKGWTWLANHGSPTRVALGDGVVALDLTENNSNEKHLLCTRADGCHSPCRYADHETVKIEHCFALVL